MQKLNRKSSMLKASTFGYCLPCSHRSVIYRMHVCINTCVSPIYAGTSYVRGSTNPLKACRNMQDDCAALNLHRCIRIYPHLQDTGGFFVALFRKKSTPNLDSEKLGSPVDDRVSEAPTLSTSEKPEDRRREETGKDHQAQSAEAKSAVRSNQFVPLDRASIQSLQESYGLFEVDDSSASMRKGELLPEHLFCRAAQVRKVSVVNSSLARLLVDTRNRSLTVLHAGQLVCIRTPIVRAVFDAKHTPENTYRWLTITRIKTTCAPSCTSHRPAIV